jgi:glucuronokinase
VAQVYQGLTYMDFNRELMERRGYGRYESLAPAMLKNVYVAYKCTLSEGSEVFHNDLRARYDAGEPSVVNAMSQWAAMAEQVRSLLQQGDGMAIGPILDANFDLRRSLCRIHPDNIAMIEGARSVGASAKFTGSGGAIIGLYSDESMFARLTKALSSQGVSIFKPTVI